MTKSSDIADRFERIRDHVADQERRFMTTHLAHDDAKWLLEQIASLQAENDRLREALTVEQMQTRRLKAELDIYISGRKP